MADDSMRWYSVHALHFLEYKQGEQYDYLVWEHIYLIQAASFKHAEQKGKRRAQQDEGDSGGTLTLDNRPVRLRFAGIRAVVECQDLDLESGEPIAGTELSYSEFRVSSHEFAKLVAGESALVLYLGRRGDETRDLVSIQS
jgi:hypothetical protein